MTGQDYYDPSPVLSLARPVVVAGFHGSQPRKTARTVCALTGLTFTDMMRRVEHRRGCSFDRALEEVGWRGIAEIETELVVRALAEPPAVIALAAHSLAEARVRSAIAAQGALVVLGVDLATAFWRVRALQQEGRSLGPDVPVLIEKIEQLRQPFGEFERIAREATLRLEVGFRSPMAVAEDVKGWLLKESQLSS